MAGSPLAVPTFVTGARDDLATADVYTRVSSTPINNVQVITDRSNQFSASGLRGGPSMANSLPSITSLIATGKAVLSGGDPLSRITGAAAVVSGALRTLSPGVQSGILGNIADGANIVASLGGVSRNIYPSNFNNVNAIGNLVNTMSNGSSNFSMRDSGALVGSLSGVIGQASRVGLPNTFGSVMSGVMDRNVINRVAAQVLPSIISSSDTGSLSSMASMCTPGALKMINPNIINNFTASYTAPVGQDYASTLTDYSQVKETFGKIDPPWASATRVTDIGLDEVINVTAIQGCSLDFRDTLSTGIRSNPSATPEEQALLIGTVYPPTDVHSEIRQSFPSTVIQSNSSSLDTTTQDPRTVAALQLDVKRRTRAQIQAEIDHNQELWDAEMARASTLLGTSHQTTDPVEKARLKQEAADVLAEAKIIYGTEIDRLNDELMHAPVR